MKPGDHNLPEELEQQWRDWMEAEPAIDEGRLRRNLEDRLPDRRPRYRAPLVLAAAAATLLVVLIGLESPRQPPILTTAEVSGVVHETGDNVILMLREDGDPIYVLLESADGGRGGIQ